MHSIFSNLLCKLFMCCLYLCLISNVIFAEDNTSQQINFAERLTRLEEGQKAILLEMRTRFEAMNKRMDERFKAMSKRMDERFAAMNKRMDDRFAAMEKQMYDRFSAMNKQMDDRFSAMNKQMYDRFSAMEKQMDYRFAAMEKQIDDRFASSDVQINFLTYFSIAIMTSIMALIGFLMWDRKTAIEKASEKFEATIQKHFFNYSQNERIMNTPSSISDSQKIVPQEKETDLSIMQKQLNYILDVMRQVPEIQQKMKADNFQGNVSAPAL